MTETVAFCEVARVIDAGVTAKLKPVAGIEMVTAGEVDGL